MLKKREGLNLRTSDGFMLLLFSPNLLMPPFREGIVPDSPVNTLPLTNLNTLSQSLRCLTIAWIKAYVGHTGNERADELAKSCSTLPITSSNLLPSPAIFKKLLWDHMYSLWHSKWQAHPHCRMSKNFLPKPSKAKSKLILNLSRGQMRRLIELITGHSNRNCPALVAQGVSARRTGHILEALLPQGELRE